MTRDPATVRAFVDGELDDMTAARIAREAAGDPILAGRIDAERRLRERLGAHFDPMLDEPVPPRLSAPIELARNTASKIVSLDSVRARRPGVDRITLRWAGPAIAAALVLALLIPGFGGSQIETRNGLTFASNELARALDSQLVSEQAQGGETRILLSFADEKGTMCRGFARADLSGIACRERGGWHLRVQRDGIDLAANDYRQASSVDNAIMAAAQEMANGPALDATQERSARARGWRGL